MTSRSLAGSISKFMLSKKAYNVVQLNLKKLTSAADFFVLCSADSDTQVKAIADAIRDGMEEKGITIYHYEGYQALTWVVLDYVDVVAHIFRRDARVFYNLDRLWGDAKRTEVIDTEETMKPKKGQGSSKLVSPYKKKKK